MKKVLFTWELGGGLGHIIHIKRLAEQYLAMGHEVYVALKELTHAGNFFSNMNVKLLQAPYKTGHRTDPILPPMSFSQLMNNNGFSSEKELEGLVRSWKTLYELVRPDVIFFDYCPSALVAARGLDCLKVTMGVSFSSPPPSKPFGVFTDTANNVEKMLSDDALVLKNTNSVLSGIGAITFETIDQIFYDDIKTCFLSLPEFDHFCARDESLYYGPVLSETGIKPHWPKKHKKKVYVYLKPFPGIRQLFKLFSRFQISFVIYTNDVPKDVLVASKASNICFETRPLNLSAVSKEADLAIVNAGHTTLCQFVLAGVPVLMIPLQMEQQMLAVRMYKQSVGWIGDTENKNFFQSIEAMLSSISNNFSIQKGIHRKYARSNFNEQHIEMCNEIINLS